MSNHSVIGNKSMNQISFSLEALQLLPFLLLVNATKETETATGSGHGTDGAVGS